MFWGESLYTILKLMMLTLDPFSLALWLVCPLVSVRREVPKSAAVHKRIKCAYFLNVNVKQMASDRHKMLAWHQVQVRLALVKWNSNTFPRVHWFSGLFCNHFISGLHMSTPEFLLKRVSISVHVHIYSIYTLHTTTISLMCVVFNFLFKSGENNVKLIHEIRYSQRL